MAEGFDISLPERGPLTIRRRAERTRTYYVAPEGGGADVLTVTGSLSVLDQMLEAYNEAVGGGGAARSASEQPVSTRWAITATDPAKPREREQSGPQSHPVRGSKCTRCGRTSSDHPAALRVAGWTWIGASLVCARCRWALSLARSLRALSLARSRSPWIVCRPRRGGGWTPLYSTTARTRRLSIEAYERDGSRYATDRRRTGVQVMRCAVVLAEGGR